MTSNGTGGAGAGMDKYHIYDEIGKGQFSQVFKGREKKKIEFVGIKRIEKSVMSKIVNEVQIMHKLTHTHILKFHDWYETRNNLWLIIEYCTGGDLEKILKQDGHLPETSIRIFGLDIIAGLKYLHNSGLIHGDLRPKNFLVDDYGLLKISDFKFTQKIPKESLDNKALDLRGCPPYMAPELFTSTGCHSFQSDFWSLGCVLFELRRGYPPFGDQSIPLPQIIDKIREIDPITSPKYLANTPSMSPNNTRNSHSSPSSNQKLKPSAEANLESNLTVFTAELADMILWLIEKVPMNRPEWEVICNHPFWNPNNPTPPTNLPSQPQYEKFCRDRLQEKLEDLELKSLLYLQIDLDYIEKQKSLKLKDDKDNHRIEKQTDVLQTPTKSPPELIKNSESLNISSHHKDQPTSGLTTNEHVTPISLNTSINNETAFKLKNDVTDGSNLSPKVMSHRMSREYTSDNHKLAENLFEAEENLLDGMACKEDTVDSYDENNQENEFPPETLLIHPTDLQVKPIVGNKSIESMEQLEFKESAIPFAVITADTADSLQLLDLEAHLTTVYKALHKTYSLTQAVQTPTSATAMAILDRINILSYLASLAPSNEVANIVLNTHFITLVLKIMKQTFPSTPASSANVVIKLQTPQNRTQNSNASNNSTIHWPSLITTSKTICATVLALMLRFTTFVQPPSIRLREEHIVPSIISLLKDSGKTDVKFKRRLLAAFGEILFYISAQEEDGMNDAANGENVQNKWIMKTSEVEFLLKALRDETDEVIRHYAAKAIENVLTQGGFEYRKKFIMVDMGVKLLELARYNPQHYSNSPSNVTTRNDAFQATCAMACFHLLSFVLTNMNSIGNLLEDKKLFTQSSNATSGKLTSYNSHSNHTQANHNAILTDTTRNGLSSSDVIMNAARFIGKVFERSQSGLIADILDIFQEGPPKLQQSYLNLMNIIFSSMNHHLIMTDHTNEEQNHTALASANTILRPLRHLFLKSPNTTSTILHSLLRLEEQGSTSAIRCKALLAIQLLMRYSITCYRFQTSSLQMLSVILNDRKLPGALTKLFDPILSIYQTSYNATNPLPGSPDIPQQAQAGFSLVTYIRLLTVHCLDTLYIQLNKVFDFIQNDNQDDITFSFKRKPSSTTNVTSNGASNGKSYGTVTTNGKVNDKNIASSLPDISELGSTAEFLMTILISLTQPTLRNLIVCFDDIVVKALSRTIRLLSTIKQSDVVHKVMLKIVALTRDDSIIFSEILAMVSDNSNEHVKHPSSPAVSAIVTTCRSFSSMYHSSIATMERSCLIAIESISLVKVSDEFRSHVQVKTTVSNSLIVPHYVPSMAGYLRFIWTTSTIFLPNMMDWINASDDDTRLVIISSIRRIVPELLAICNEYPPNHIDELFHNLKINPTISNGFLPTISKVLGLFIEKIVVLLQMESDPIPQYTLKALLDITNQVPMSLFHEVIQTMDRNSIFKLFFSWLSGEETSLQYEKAPTERVEDSPMEEEKRIGFNSSLSYMNDPILIHIFTSIFEKDTANSSMYLLDHQIVSILSHVLLDITYNHPSGPTQHPPSVQYTTEQFEDYLKSFIPAIDFQHIILNYIIKTINHISNQSKGIVEEKSLQTFQHANRQHVDKLRTAVGACRTLISPLFYILWITSQRWNHKMDEDYGTFGSPDNPFSLYEHTVEVCSRCIGMIFDIFPDVVATQIISMQTIRLDYKINSNGKDRNIEMKRDHHPPRYQLFINFRDEVIPPRVCISQLILNPLVDMKVKIRMLRIVSATVKMIISLGMKDKAKEFVLTQPILPMLTTCSLPDNKVFHAHKNKENTADYESSALSMLKVTSQILEIGKSL